MDESGGDCTDAGVGFLVGEPCGKEHVGLAVRKERNK
jgi:hypothetical protein